MSNTTYEKKRSIPEKVWTEWERIRKYLLSLNVGLSRIRIMHEITE